MIGVKVAKNLSDWGSRPSSAACFRMAWILGLRTDGEWEETKMPSACVAPKADPAEDVPAWKRKGVLCGEGSTICRLSTL